ncbi:GAF domain-containing protein [Nostoc sp. UCD121]|uniref:GAF domain-containing protein n=1 Tax=unclassified Nostoc TaxID=2593658 RepID=UPI00162809F1|nr:MULTISPECIES: GAF domain-containing protein [unclassified Nostoc]MBC1224891.1 GAF domain-containing protein [Nostoc sp. UCD120]MBC1279018.1 GAF domain-containing protein [Nostoc sp. UCD121]MBC1297719.1 GAF domain-containing protein [Nostoc sp. UCD122]
MTIATLDPNSETQPVENEIQIEEILANVALIKAVFQSAKGPKVAQLQQKVSQIEAFIQALAKDSPSDNDENVRGAFQLQREQLAAIDRQMQQTKGQTALLEVTVTALRDFLNADRVLIYRFEEDNRSRAIAEAIQAGWRSLLNQSLPINLFVNKPDVSDGQNLLNNLTEVLELTPRQQQFWQRFQVQASLCLPLIVKQQPWGLLVVHHCFQPRQWQEAERSLLQQVGMMLTINLHSAEIIAPPAQQLESLDRSELLVPFQQVSQAVQEGARIAELAGEHLMSIQDTVAITNKQLQYLGEFCQQASGFVHLVEGLSTKIQVLSLNTAIEATKTSKQERGLLAAAEQVEILARQARDSTLNIEEWFQELQVAATDVASAIEPCDRQISAGLESIAQIQKQFRAIADIAACSLQTISKP